MTDKNTRGLAGDRRGGPDLSEIRRIADSGCLLRDRIRLRRSLRDLGRGGYRDQKGIARLEEEALKAAELYERRQALQYTLSYPEDLPVSARREEILEALASSQVLVIAGDTGSGKTTQLPKMCLEAGCARYGLIGHTQPRRIAARSVAERLSQEMGTEFGGVVGCKVRFSDQSSLDTLIRLMTDGILLSELSSDRLLSSYGAIIVDEAHERSLNIDFLLGCLKRILEKRPDLKLIITSATIDVERFARHFGGAKIISVAGRTYPVETFYRPPEEDPDNPDGDMYTEVLLALRDLEAAGRGDVLVFLDGERTIRELGEFLGKQNLRGAEILPLYARLPAGEQSRIFAPHATWRIILATNVAETSLTVPGIRYVIDCGLARISRYSLRTKVQRLPVEPVSRASADQRRGRCGRTEPGICVRLYSQEDYESRPAYTDPEILRTNLASVILQMMTLKLGRVEDFPFIDPPEHRLVADGWRTLEEIGAVSGGQITREGRIIARIPADPRLARMLLAAERQGCLREMLVIVSALSAQDPREYPLNKKDAAVQAHQRFADDNSDFMALLNLWKYTRDVIRDQSQSALRRRCRREFLSYMRIREWEDLHRQLTQTCRDLKFRFNQAEADYASLHRSVAAAMFSHLGMKSPDSNDYVGARGARFLIAYTSSLHRKKCPWVLAAELTETSRLYARTVARVEPEWLEEAGDAYLKRSYSDVHWSRKSAAVLASMKVTLFGLPVVASRSVQYGTIDPAMCRELFIRHGLVEGDLDCSMKFFRDNRRLVEQVLEEEDRARRRDILVSDDDLFLFYDQRIPEDVTGWVSFKKWWEGKSREDPAFLNFDLDFLISDREKIADKEYFPDSTEFSGYRVGLSYRFDPTAADDGVTIRIPLAILGQASSRDFEFIVPGLRLEFFTEIIRTLPKALRKRFIPAPVYAQKLMDAVDPHTTTLWKDIESCLSREGGVEISRDDFDLEALPRHLKFNFAVTDERGRSVAQGRDLEVLKSSLGDRMKSSFSAIVREKADETLYKEWNFGPLEKSRKQKSGGLEITVYPSLRDEGKGVRKTVCGTAAEQQSHLWKAVRRLIMLGIASPVAYLHERLPNRTKLRLYCQGAGTITELIDDCIGAAVDHLMRERGGLVWSQEEFAALLEGVRGKINETVAQAAEKTEVVLELFAGIRKQLKGRVDFTTAFGFSHAKAQLEGYVHPGFVTETGFERLDDLRRYLRALSRRLDRIRTDPRGDEIRNAMLDDLDKQQKDLTLGYPSPEAVPQEIRELKWMIDEFRVSLYAQMEGTRYPVSEKRVRNEIARLRELKRG